MFNWWSFAKMQHRELPTYIDIDFLTLTDILKSLVDDSQSNPKKGPETIHPCLITILYSIDLFVVEFPSIHSTFWFGISAKGKS